MSYAHHRAVVCSSVSDSVTDGNHFYNIQKKGDGYKRMAMTFCLFFKNSGLLFCLFCGFCWLTVVMKFPAYALT